jgi:hypothetical protein
MAHPSPLMHVPITKPVSPRPLPQQSTRAVTPTTWPFSCGHATDRREGAWPSAATAGSAARSLQRLAPRDLSHRCHLLEGQFANLLRAVCGDHEPASHRWPSVAIADTNHGLMIVAAENARPADGPPTTLAKRGQCATLRLPDALAIEYPSTNPDDHVLSAERPGRSAAKPRRDSQSYQEARSPTMCRCSGGTSRGFGCCNAWLGSAPRSLINPCCQAIHIRNRTTAGRRTKDIAPRRNPGRGTRP